MTTGLRRLLVERHGDAGSLEREWAVFFELPNGTGARGDTRYVDAFALNLWPSKKFWRVAYELKSNRADFLRELEMPHKRQWAFDVSNEFWFLCASGVAKPEEVPEGCGLLVANEDLTKLRKVKPALQRQAKDLTPQDVAAFARKSVQPLDLLFRYAGQELDSAGLARLLDEKMDDHTRALVAERVQRDVSNQVRAVTSALAGYARDMREAGIEPPAWMVTGNLSGDAVWDAHSWAKRELVTKTGMDAILVAQKETDRVLRELQQATDRALQARAALERLSPVTYLPTGSDGRGTPTGEHDIL